MNHTWCGAFFNFSLQPPSLLHLTQTMRRRTAPSFHPIFQCHTVWLHLAGPNRAPESRHVLYIARITPDAAFSQTKLLIELRDNFERVGEGE